jgi:hypothetical protein
VGVVVCVAAGRRLEEAAALAGVVGVVMGLLVALSDLIASRFIAAEVRAALAESSRVRDSIRAGHLGLRAEPGRVHPELRPLLRCMNEAVEAFAVPFEQTTAALTRLSRGDPPERLSLASGRVAHVSALRLPPCRQLVTGPDGGCRLCTPLSSAILGV